MKVIARKDIECPIVELSDCCNTKWLSLRSHMIIPFGKSFPLVKRWTSPKMIYQFINPRTFPSVSSREITIGSGALVSVDYWSSSSLFQRNYDRNMPLRVRTSLSLLLRSGHQRNEFLQLVLHQQPCNALWMSGWSYYWLSLSLLLSRLEGIGLKMNEEEEIVCNRSTRLGRLIVYSRIKVSS